MQTDRAEQCTEDSFAHHYEMHERPAEPHVSAGTLDTLLVMGCFQCPAQAPCPCAGAQVDLVLQQAEVLRTHTELRVAAFVGSMAINYCQPEAWRAAIEDNDVLVMTHQILLNILRHAILTVQALPSLSGLCCSHLGYKTIPALPQLRSA